MKQPRPTDRARRQRGMSLVELMVGITIGLLIVAAATTVTVTQLTDSRRLVLEAQVQQDLRATADIITREVRRAGHWTNAATAVWTPSAGTTANPFDDVTIGAGSVSVRRTDNDPVQFDWVTSPVGMITMTRGGGGAQALTDSATLVITEFSPVLQSVDLIRMDCVVQCAGPDPTACWPTVEVRELEITIRGRAASDAAVERSIRTSVRLRNDRIVNNNGAGPLCPV